MIRTSETITKIAPALLAAQRAIGTVAKDSKNPHFNSRYAALPEVMDAVKPILNEHDLILMQGCDGTSEKGITLSTRIQHISGEFFEDALFVPASKLDPQGFGSAMTYARRYGIQSMTGLVADDDDDGNAASAPRNDRREAPRQERQAAPQRQAEPARAAQRNGNGNGHTNGSSNGNGDRKAFDPTRCPTSGKGLFAWCKDNGAKHNLDLVKYLNGWGQAQGFGDRMVDWSTEDIAEAHAEGLAKINEGSGDDGDDDTPY
jgi:hypothetical protein